MIAPSIQSLALDQVVAALNAAAAAAFTSPVKAYRCRVEAFDKGEPLAYNVIPDDGEYDSQNSYSNATAHKLRFCVRCTVSAHNEADKAADPLFVVAMPAILNDPTLGGIVNFTRYLSQKWEKDGPAENDNLALVLMFESEFSTSRTDPTVAAS
jgi:hypothetical protein